MHPIGVWGKYRNSHRNNLDKSSKKLEIQEVFVSSCHSYWSVCHNRLPRKLSYTWSEVLPSHLHSFEHALFSKQEAIMGDLFSLFWEVDPPPIPLSFTIPSQEYECRKDDSCGTIGSFLLWYFVIILVLMFLSRASVWVGYPISFKIICLLYHRGFSIK